MLIFSHSAGVKKNRGMAILFAVLTSAILSAIAVSAFNIAMKELKLSATAEETMIAFYAADSAVECIMYWDLVKNAFAKSTAANLGDDSNDLPTVLDCGYMTKKPATNPFSVPVWIGEESALSPSPRIFGGNPLSEITNPAVNIPFLFPTMNNACSYIVISKRHETPGIVESKIFTKINAFGRNSCDTSNARRLERGIELNY